MRRSRRSTFLVTAVLAVLAASTWQPALVAGRTSAGQGSQLVARIAGSVVLPNGRVLPPAPPGSLGPSEMAVQWRAHANDRISFHPGAKPRKLEDAPIILAAEPSTVAGTELIPLAHPLPLTHVDVAFEIDADEGTVTLVAEARTTARTGVELEAMMACSVGAMAVYDMVKGIEPGVVIERVELLEKTGGKADFRR